MVQMLVPLKTLLTTEPCLEIRVFRYGHPGLSKLARNPVTGAFTGHMQAKGSGTQRTSYVELRMQMGITQPRPRSLGPQIPEGRQGPFPGTHQRSFEETWL